MLGAALSANEAIRAKGKSEWMGKGPEKIRNS